MLWIAVVVLTACGLVSLRNGCAQKKEDSAMRPTKFNSALLRTSDGSAKPKREGVATPRTNILARGLVLQFVIKFGPSLLDFRGVSISEGSNLKTTFKE
jgi:hypothetical protein